MFRKISNSWSLVKASWAVLMADKELLIFPILSFLAATVVTLTFLIPSFLAGLFDTAVIGSLGIAGWIVGFLFYVIMYTVTFFANAALVGAAMIRMEGGDPTLGDGVRIALKNFSAIVGYAVISATVGMILRTISERSGVIGRLVIGIVGFTWNIATFLAVPVMVMEENGPIESVKRSASLLKSTWGEQIAGNFSMGVIFGLLSFAVILLAVPMVILAAMSGSALLIITTVLLAVATLMGLSLISTTLNGIYTAAVYRYAVTGEAFGYDAALLKESFKHR